MAKRLCALVAWTVIFARAVLACEGSTGGQPEAAREGGSEHSGRCTEVEAPTSCPDPAPRFEDVARIFGERCVTPCHSGTPNGPWRLSSYDDIAAWPDEIRSRLEDCEMPPADAGVPLTRNEKLAILTWIQCGLPE